MLEIPSVSQDDLAAFHTRVFGSSPLSTNIYLQEPITHDEATQNHVETEDDDGFGYYHDGNKRTLTDDQIAMFRHSEIYAILRERQVRKENEEADINPGYDTQGNGHGESSVEDLAPLESGKRCMSPGEHLLNEDGEGFDSEFLGSAPANVVLKSEGGHGSRLGQDGARKRPFESDAQNDQGPGPQSKRKRQFNTFSSKARESFTSRRLARELDTVSSEDQILDYGDGATEKEDSSTNAQPDARAVVSRIPDGDGANGKKIWWPIIQAS